MGHSVVDQLIIDIGKRLRSRLRHDDTVSRSTAIGGRPLGNETLARMDGNQLPCSWRTLRDQPIPCVLPCESRKVWPHALLRATWMSSHPLALASP